MDLVPLLLLALRASGKHLVWWGFKRAISFLVSISLASLRSHLPTCIFLLELALPLSFLFSISYDSSRYHYPVYIFLLEMALLLKEIIDSSHFLRSADLHLRKVGQHLSLLYLSFCLMTSMVLGYQGIRSHFNLSVNENVSTTLAYFV